MKKVSFGLKIIIYIVLVIALIIFYFACSNKVKSYKKFLEQESQKTSSQIYQNYKEIISKSEKDPLELSLEAESLYDKGLINFSTIALNKALEQNPPYRDLYLFAATVYFNQKNFSLAKETAEKASEFDPVYAPTYELLSKIYTALGDEENSKLCYNKAKKFEKQ